MIAVDLHLNNYKDKDKFLSSVVRQEHRHTDQFLFGRLQAHDWSEPVHFIVNYDEASPALVKITP